MVEEIVAHTRLVSQETGREALSERVLAVMGKIPRHEFVPVEIQPYAYVNSPLPIGFGKTISQPFMVALMTDLLDLEGGDVVLEVGSGLGYHAAVLAELVQQVYTVEIIEELATGARRRFERLKCRNVSLRVGDGSRGWAEHAPFDKILVAAAPELVPPMLISQLKPGGRMVVPAGIENAQELLLVEKNEGGRTKMTPILPVRFSALMTEG
ncbi:MAG: protein-L-isoaspartate(D-aspartate) O-methyltransferase [Proteobacteria bacterium]|nr:protein-L-isoaspartate(D-aspartate) O-methyltransferase [Pseudomonadota bacterium]